MSTHTTSNPRVSKLKKSKKDVVVESSTKVGGDEPKKGDVTVRQTDANNKLVVKSRGGIIGNERLWKEIMEKETINNKRWYDMWGFLLEDADDLRDHGNTDKDKKSEEVSADVTKYTSPAGVIGRRTSNRRYGERLNSPLAATYKFIEGQAKVKRRTGVTDIPND